VLGATVGAGDSITIDVEPERHVYLVSSGKIHVNGIAAQPRDGIAITGEKRIAIEAEERSELVLVDAR
jgi:redox-sensitive bicupin YhaK (pirin superfamily)